MTTVAFMGNDVDEENQSSSALVGCGGGFETPFVAPLTGRSTLCKKKP
jgi:hypothetical protein